MALLAWIKRIFNLDLEKSYVSPADQFLQEFDRQHPQKSPSQQREIVKHARIAALRDYPQSADSLSASTKSKEIWEEF